MSLIQRLTRIIAGEDYDLSPWDPDPLVDIEPKTPIVGGDKPVKIKAKTSMIPAAKLKQELKNFASMFIPIIPPWMVEFEEDEKHYLVPKKQMNMLVSDEDVDDWNYLLERFNNLLANLTKLLNNIRKVDYNKIVHDKLLEREIRNRKIKLTEKLLEKTEEKEEKASKNTPQSQIENMNMLMMAVANSFIPRSSQNVNPLDAATLEQLNEDGSALKAAAFLGTLEASSPQDVADTFQVMLNRASKNHSGYGGLFEQITAPEQFSPYSAAIYGDSADTTAASYYGGLGITLQELAEMSSAPDAFEQLQARFGAGSASIAQQVLADFESEGTLSQNSKEFIGGMVSFRGAGSDIGDNYSQRHEDANKFFASGAIVIPQLLDEYVWYNTNDRTDNLAKFIVDRPTIIDTAEIGEPLIVIPTERPIGQQILNILFKEPFRKIEKIFERNQQQKEQQEAKAQTPIQNNTTSITRSPIPESSRPTSNYLQRQQQSSLYNEDMKLESIAGGYSSDSIQSGITRINTKVSNLTRQSQTTTRRSLSNIDTVSQKTDNVFGAKVILMTQDIYATEE